MELVPLQGAEGLVVVRLELRQPLTLGRRRELGIQDRAVSREHAVATAARGADGSLLVEVQPLKRVWVEDKSAGRRAVDAPARPDTPKVRDPDVT